MKRIYTSFIILFSVFCSLSAQDKKVMSRYQDQLVDLFEQVYNAPTDNERYHANESAVQLLSKALEEEDSFKWRWNFGSRVSVLTASSGKFRIFSWPVRRDNNEQECFGFVQAYDEEEDEWVVTELHDRSDEVFSPEESMLTADSWYGSVYQELVETKHDGQYYYTLLGWNCTNPLIQRKVIEPIWFKRDRAVPQFGQPLFRKAPNRRRVILAYTTTAMVNLHYEDQVIHTVEKKRVKIPGTNKSTTQDVGHDEVERMIIFDEVAPQVQGMEGLFQYYVPTGVELAYVFRNGKWEMRKGAQGRLSDKKLNKAFEPLDKDPSRFNLSN
ncbi:MAG: hypothetical protein KBT04_00140 [Bacteroidales bacterium]|nr:hypothetical protein [Candidatus Colimorpha onthohippi]